MPGLNSLGTSSLGVEDDQQDVSSPLIKFPSDQFSYTKALRPFRRTSPTERGSFERGSRSHRPLFQFTVQTSALSDTQLQELQDFWNVAAFDETFGEEFLFEDKRSQAHSGIFIGSGTGSKYEFNLEHDITYGNRSAGTIDARYIQSGTDNVRLDGSGTEDYTLNQHRGSIIFSSAPSSGTVIKADYETLHRVTFSENSFQQSMQNGLHTQAQLKLIEVEDN